MKVFLTIPKKKVSITENKSDKKRVEIRISTHAAEGLL